MNLHKVASHGSFLFLRTVRQDYKREDENAVPWPVAKLQEAPNPDTQGFHDLDKFSIKSLFGAVAPIPFAPYLQFSNNYYRPSWSLTCAVAYAPVIIVSLPSSRRRPGLLQCHFLFFPSL